VLWRTIRNRSLDQRCRYCHTAEQAGQSRTGYTNRRFVDDRLQKH